MRVTDADQVDPELERGGSRYSDFTDTHDLMVEAKRETSRANRLISVVMLALIAAAIGLAWWTRSDSTDTAALDEPVPVTEADAASDGDASDGDENQEATTTDTAEDGDAGDDAAAQAGSGEEEDAGDGGQPAVVAVLPAPPADRPYVDATLTENVFVLSGVVPSEDIKQAIETQAELSYAPFASSELRVDESMGDAAWLVSAPQIVGLLPMITDGTIRVQDGEVTLAGRSPNPDYAAGFEQAIGQITGLPVSADGIGITNLTPPRFVATVENGQVALDGEIPSEQLLATFIQGAAAVYGAENVTSTMTVDEGTYTSFWNYTMPGIFQLFAPFPVYRIQVEDGVTSGTMQGGVLFDLNSAEITPSAAEVLNVGVALLAHDRSLTMTVIGHTDVSGPNELNLRLSLARAESVTGYLAGAGIDPARLNADGRGSDEPIASNDTDEGRALNRRVEFIFD